MTTTDITTKPLDCETSRCLEDERIRSHPDTTVTGSLVGASALVRREGLDAYLDAHAADPHCRPSKGAAMTPDLRLPRIPTLAIMNTNRWSAPMATSRVMMT